MTWYYRRHRRILITTILLLFALISLGNMTLKLKDAFMVVSKSRVQTIGVKIINKIVADKLNDLPANNLMIYQKDNNGQITAIDVDIVTMNKISNEINTEVVNAFDNLSDTYIYVPLGSASGYDLLAATGPMIPIKILPMGDIHLDFKTEFLSTGINQTTHKIYLDVNCTMDMITTFEEDNVEINQKIHISETVIIGNVPETYYNFKGIEADELTNMIN